MITPRLKKEAADHLAEYLCEHVATTEGNRLPLEIWRAIATFADVGNPGILVTPGRFPYSKEKIEQTVSELSKKFSQNSWGKSRTGYLKYLAGIYDAALNAKSGWTELIFEEIDEIENKQHHSLSFTRHPEFFSVLKVQHTPYLEQISTIFNKDQTRSIPEPEQISGWLEQIDALAFADNITSNTSPPTIRHYMNRATVITKALTDGASMIDPKKGRVLAKEAACIVKQFNAIVADDSQDAITARLRVTKTLWRVAKKSAVLCDFQLPPVKYFHGKGGWSEYLSTLYAEAGGAYIKDIFGGSRQDDLNKLRMLTGIKQYWWVLDNMIEDNCIPGFKTVQIWELGRKRDTIVF